MPDRPTIIFLLIFNFQLQVDTKIVYAGYKIEGLKHNIAVLKFKHNLLNEGAQPICLWNQNLLNDDHIVAQNDGIGTVKYINRKKM